MYEDTMNTTISKQPDIEFDTIPVKETIESLVQPHKTPTKTIQDIIDQAKRDGTYKDPYAGIDFIEFHPVIKDRDGKVLFDQKVIFPDYFNDQAVKIVASKYLCNVAKLKETDLRQMIDRVANTITNFAIKDQYFTTIDEILEFNYKLKYYQIKQYCSFNSPVYFNIGLSEDGDKSQLAACFILSVDDSMQSITEWLSNEAKVFKAGSGVGVNLSKLRSSKERVKGGGFASGAVSFLKASDTLAAVIRSGGTLRRAAKMACLNIDHPDIINFISCKNREEEKLRLIKQANMTPPSGMEYSDDVYFQNVNLSVRLTDDFMRAVEADADWYTKEVLTGKPVERFKARDLLMQLSTQAWTHGEPGTMYHDTINEWNTVPDEGEIEASNPCVVGDTLLRSPEGDFKIKDLVESGRTEIPVYCCDPSTGAVHIRMGRNPRKTGEKKPVYKVTFSKGRGGIHSITTTANHKFIDSDGNTVLCKDLVFDGKGKTRLMPFNKLIEKYRTSGGKEVYIYNKGMKIKESHLILNWKNGSPITFGRQANDLVAHHIDGNHLNNHPDNLEAITNTVHCSNHSSGENNPRYGAVVSEESRQKMSESHKNRIRERPHYTEICDQCEQSFETRSTYFPKGKFCSPECRIIAQNNKRQQRHLVWIESVKHECPHCKTMVLSNAVTCGSDVCIRKAQGSSSNYEGVSYDRKRAAIASIRSKALNLGASFLCEGFDISTPTNWDMFLDADLETFNESKRTTSKIILKYWGNWIAFLTEVESRNHIVLNVEYAGEEDVYNITVDEFHTVAWGEVITHNCGEWNFLNNSVCNLAATNLLKFFSFKDGRFVFDYATYADVVRVVTIAQDLFVENGLYPTPEVEYNAHRFHAIGHGFSNLGASLMYLGLPYDSDEARALASSITSLMTGIVYQTSTELARTVGTVGWWDNAKNHNSYHRILSKHRAATDNINICDNDLIREIKQHCCNVWHELDDNFKPGRLASASLLAPTGTTGFLMMCTGFGVEPIYGNVIYKTLSGHDGAMIKYVNDVMKDALHNLGYSLDTIENIIKEIIDDDIPPEKSKFIKPEHVAVFDTASVPSNGTRFVSPNGHVMMMAAVQPFLSSAISKTTNLPNNATVQDVYDLYINAWKLGLKSITVYRDGSKVEQIMTSRKDDKQSSSEKAEISDSIIPVRKKMPTDRNAKIHKFMINGNVEGYIITGHYPDGQLGELFITMSKDGSTLRGFTDALATITSIAIQSGTSLETIVAKMIYRKFEPAGFCANNPDIKTCTSIIDYVFKYIAFNYLSDDKLIELGLKRTVEGDLKSSAKFSVSSTPCPVCGELMHRLGSCFSCVGGCGYSNGVCG